MRFFESMKHICYTEQIILCEKYTPINKTINLLIVCVPLGSKIWKHLVIFYQEVYTNSVSR